MLIDSTHKKWAVAFLVLAAAAVVGQRLLGRLFPGEPTGGSFVGLWYGVLGSALMIYAGLLSAHRQAPRKTWLGARKTWLRGHIWLGLLSLVFILCHSNYSWGGVLERLLWAALIAVIVTGVAGLVLQNVLPRLLTSRVPTEAPYEQIPHLCHEMRRQADALVDGVCGPFDPSPQALESTMAVVRYASDALAQFRDFYEHDVRPFLGAEPPRNSPLLNPLQAEARFGKLQRLPGLAEHAEAVDQLARFCEERRLMAEQERIHFWLHSWLLLHIPLSVALLVLGVAHVYTALYY